jgi:hypothetical protein
LRNWQLVRAAKRDFSDCLRQPKTGFTNRYKLEAGHLDLKRSAKADIS